jgi:hypothetical protein
VPYKGTANVLQALMSGEIPAAIVPIGDLGTLVQSGKGRILATSGAKRSPQYPDVPTFKESGYDIEGEAWYALFAPKGTPKDVIDSWPPPRSTPSGSPTSAPPRADRLRADRPRSGRAGSDPARRLRQMGAGNPRLGLQGRLSARKAKTDTDVRLQP